MRRLEPAPGLLPGNELADGQLRCSYNGPGSQIIFAASFGIEASMLKPRSDFYSLLFLSLLFYAPLVLHPAQISRTTTCQL